MLLCRQDTFFIEEIEDANKYFFFIRPRRFGKSITLSMLENYYDINKKEQFEDLFGGLYIGEYPTPEHNSYLIIDLNFSIVVDGLDDYKQGLDEYCNTQFNYFADVYSDLLPPDTKEGLNSKKDAINQLNYLCTQCEKTGQKIYLFIDEYDHFTNQIIANKQHKTRYRQQTHSEGYLRKFFDNASILPFNHTIDQLIQVMKPWYDNYCFAEEAYGKTTMYNSIMVLNFIDNYIRSGYQIPKKMVEMNIRIDYDKIRMLIRHDKDFANDANIIQDLVTKGFVTGKLMENFPAERINDPDNFLSLLFYFDMVTIEGEYKGATKFIIPNEVVRDQMYTYLLDTYKENELTYEAYDKGKLESKLAYDGDYKPYFNYIANCLKRYASQRDKQKGEAFFVHGFTLAMTSQCQFYRPISELDNVGGYADIFLSPLCDIYKDMMDSYIVELKYCKASTTDEQVKKLFTEASAQICRYADSDIVRESVKTTQLHKLVVIYRGTEMVECKEAEEY